MPLTPDDLVLSCCSLLAGFGLLVIGQALTYLAASAYYAKGTYDLVDLQQE